MNIKVNRAEPIVPPVSDVVITLTPEEAKALGIFFGYTSRAKIDYVMGGVVDEKFKNTLFPVIAMVYDTLYGEGLLK